MRVHTQMSYAPYILMMKSATDSNVTGIDRQIADGRGQVEWEDTLLDILQQMQYAHCY